MKRILVGLFLALLASGAFAQTSVAPGQLAYQSVQWVSPVPVDDTGAGGLVSVVRHTPGEDTTRRSVALEVCNYEAAGSGNDVYVNLRNPSIEGAVDMNPPYTDMWVRAGECRSFVNYAAHTIAFKAVSGTTAVVGVTSMYVLGG